MAPTATTPAAAGSEAAARPPSYPAARLWEIFMAFARCTMMAFGGGTSSWFMRELVDRRRWLTAEEFLTGFALAQAFPGVNVVNLSIWIGFRMRRSVGALVAALGTILPPAILAIVTLTLLDQLTQYRPAAVIMTGVAAAAIGMTISMGVRVTRATATRLAPVLVIVAIIVGLFVLHLPMTPVLAVVAPISIAAAYWRLRRERGAP